MKTYEIIEEGRLSKSEMGTLVGGDLICSKNYHVYTDPDVCKEESGLASCPEIYSSCVTGGENKSCVVGSINSPTGYSGAPGPAGDTEPVDGPGTCSIILYAEPD